MCQRRLIQQAVQVTTMSNAMEPGEADAALHEIVRREQQVIEAAIVPGWYWWVIAAASIGLGIVVDGRNAAAIAVTAVVYAAGVALLTVWVILGGIHRVKVHDDLLGPEGALLIVGFVAVLVVGTIGMAWALRAAGVEMPGTISTTACGVALVIGGPALMRRLRVLMSRHAAGAR
jgi:hypothetical protein